MKSRHGVIAAALCSAAVLASQFAFGAFTPVNCPAYPSTTTVPFTYTIGAFYVNPEQPHNPNYNTEYINYVDWTRHFIGNNHVKRFGFRVDSFTSENTFDRLYYGDPFYLGNLTGTPATGWYDFVLTNNMQRDPFKFRWYADYSATFSGFSIGEARVSCSTSSDTTVHTISPYVRYTAVLLGSNDVVYLAINNTSATSPLKHDAVALWSSDASTDFDYYIRCNALPTASNYDYYGASSSNNEFVHLSNTACTSGGTYYVAINSYSGKGTANFVWTRHAATEHRVIRAGSSFGRAATSSELADMEETSKRAARRFYGATEGMKYVSEIQYWDNNGCSSCGGQPCELCFHLGSGTDVSGNCSGKVDLYTWKYDPFIGGYDSTVLAHEWGHRYLCQDDEYCAYCGNYSQCGHSIMSRSSSTLNNLCIAWDHGRDYDTSVSPYTPTGQPNAWSRIASNDFYNPTTTPDNYSYEPFPFLSSGLFGKVEVGKFIKMN